MDNDNSTFWGLVSAIPCIIWFYLGKRQIKSILKIDYKVSSYHYLVSIKEKIEKIAKEIYGADGVEYDNLAKLHLKRIERLGFNDFAICMAKTQKSFSDNESLIGRPKGFTITVREITIASGAQFIIPILGKMMRMPGLPAKPASENMSIDKDGVISGLS